MYSGVELVNCFWTQGTWSQEQQKNCVLQLSVALWPLLPQCPSLPWQTPSSDSWCRSSSLGSSFAECFQPEPLINCHYDIFCCLGVGVSQSLLHCVPAHSCNLWQDSGPFWLLVRSFFLFLQCWRLNSGPHRLGRRCSTACAVRGTAQSLPTLTVSKWTYNSVAPSWWYSSVIAPVPPTCRTFSWPTVELIARNGFIVSTQPVSLSILLYCPNYTNNYGFTASYSV